MNYAAGNKTTNVDLL